MKYRLYLLAIHLALFCFAERVRADFANPVTVADTLKNATGSSASHVVRMTVSWPAFIATGNIPVAKGSTDVTITDGEFSVELEATETSNPAFVYTVEFFTIKGYLVMRQHWRLPTSEEELKIGDVIVADSIALLGVNPTQLLPGGATIGDYLRYTSEGWRPSSISASYPSFGDGTTNRVRIGNGGSGANPIIRIDQSAGGNGKIRFYDNGTLRSTINEYGFSFNIGQPSAASLSSGFDESVGAVLISSLPIQFPYTYTQIYTFADLDSNGPTGVGGSGTGLMLVCRNCAKTNPCSLSVSGTPGALAKRLVPASYNWDCE